VSNVYWQVEVRNTDVGVLRGSWVGTGIPWAMKGAAIAQAKKLTTTCACGDRHAELPQNVRIREWRPIAEVDYLETT
jgi:hypothetical protein